MYACSLGTHSIRESLRDVRWPEKILHRHTSTHSDDITCVHFQPPGNRSGEILLSASSDGLICTTDARQSDEDEAGLFVGSWQRSVSHCGWMGSSGVWSASDMETLTVWSNEVSSSFFCPVGVPSTDRA